MPTPAIAAEGANIYAAPHAAPSKDPVMYPVAMESLSQPLVNPAFISPPTPKDVAPIAIGSVDPIVKGTEIQIPTITIERTVHFAHSDKFQSLFDPSFYSTKGMLLKMLYPLTGKYIGLHIE